MPLSKLDNAMMARRAAGEIAPGAVVAVDKGLPESVPEATPPMLGAWFWNSNGTLGDIPLGVADAAALARSGCVDLALVNAAQVSTQGDFAGVLNAAHPGLRPPGNVVDLVSNARRVVAMLPHVGGDGAPNLVESLSSPADGVGCVDAIVTDAAFIEIRSGELVLSELAPGWTVADVQAVTGPELSVSPSLREMDFTPPTGQPATKVYPDGISAIADLPDGATVFIDGFGGPGGMAHYLLGSVDI